MNRFGWTRTLDGVLATNFDLVAGWGGQMFGEVDR